MRRLATLACVAGLALLAGCGGDDEEFDPIPASQADALTTQLDAVAGLVPDRCGSASFQIGELEEKVDALPDGVDPDVRSALDDGLDRLRDLVEQECAEEELEETDTVETETVPTETQPTDTEPTDTEPSDTGPSDPLPTDTEPTETVPEAPPEGGVPPGFQEQVP